MLVDLFDNVHWLRPLWLMTIPLIIGLFLLLARTSSRHNTWQGAIDPELLQHLQKSPDNPGADKRLPLWLAALACCIAAIALAGPSWEKLPTAVAKKQDRLVIIADLTASMQAQDLTPSRLVRMRYKLLELLKQRKEGETALIAYSGTAHIVSPLTEDSNTIAALVPVLAPDIMPAIGSDAGAAFKLASNLLQNQPDWLSNHNATSTMLWFTDQMLPADSAAIKAAIADTGSTLVIIGIGTQQGVSLTAIPEFPTNNSPPVTVGLDRQPLIDVARQVSGYYLDLRTDNANIDFILGLNASFAPIEDGNNERNAQFDRWHDRGGWLAIMLIPFVLLAFRRGWLLGLCLLLAPLYPEQLYAETAPSTAPSSHPRITAQQIYNHNWKSWWQSHDQQAAALRTEGKLQHAYQLFENQSWKGVSAYEYGDYFAAVNSFSEVIKQLTDDPDATPANKAEAHYNLGHALTRSKQLEQAIAAYNQALALAPDFSDAQKAKALVESLLEQQKQGRLPIGKSQQPGQQSNQQSNQQQQSSQSDQKQSGNQPSGENRPGKGHTNPGQENKTSSQQTTDKNQPPQPSSSPGSQSDTSGQQLTEQQASSTLSPVQPDQSSYSDPGEEKPSDADAPPETSHTNPEPATAQQQLQLEQWLNQIEDDPSGLLRRKFQYQREEREKQGSELQTKEATTGENGQWW